MKTVGIVGLGLIGGSMAKAYAAAGWRVLGDDRDQMILDFAKMSGAVEAPLTEENIKSCDLLLLAILYFLFREGADEELLAALGLLLIL